MQQYTRLSARIKPTRIGLVYYGRYWKARGDHERVRGEIDAGVKEVLAILA